MAVVPRITLEYSNMPFIYDEDDIVEELGISAQVVRAVVRPVRAVFYARNEDTSKRSYKCENGSEPEFGIAFMVLDKPAIATQMIKMWNNKKYCGRYLEVERCTRDSFSDVLHKGDHPVWLRHFEKTVYYDDASERYVMEAIFKSPSEQELD